ncbi:MAG TPA: hypothetical protein VLK65_01455 [Vicinamibacteria bacterium]|nr:hypothetical protein [Vicinamibacteria bacterium]
MHHHDRIFVNTRRICLAAALIAAVGLAGCGGRGGEPVESRPITPHAEFNKSRAPIGSPVEITYRFDVGADSAPVPKDYHVFVHFLDSHNALLFTDDHVPPEPTSSWKAGSTVEYKRTLFIPLYPYLGTATVSMGLYDPGTNERLGLAGSDDGNNAYRVAQLQLLDQKENIFLVYKEGWHQLESAPENPSIEWQWTKKEAVCSFRNPKRESILYIEADTNVNAFPEEPLQVSLVVGETEIGSLKVETRDTFLKKIPIPLSALGGEDWVDLRIVNSESFVPSGLGLAIDDRELGLRVYHLYVEALDGT